MAIRIELDKTYVKQALEAALASLKRSKDKHLNPMMRELVEKDIAMLANAINTITEVK